MLEDAKAGKINANTSKKLRAVFEANARSGKYKTNYPPYGYLKGTDKNCTPIVDPYSAGGRDVDEYIRRMKSYAGATKLTRDMTLELIKYIKVDAHPGHRNLPRTIHIFYKLIDYK